MRAAPTHLHPSLSKTLEGAAWLSLQPLALNALSVPVLALIIHRLGPEGYGQWTVASALLAVMTTVSSLGLRGAFVRALAADPDSARESLAEQLGLRILLASLAGIVAVLVCAALRYPAPILWSTIIGVAALGLTACSSTLADLLQSFHRARTLAGVSMAAGLLLTGVSALVAWLDPRPTSIAIAYATGPALSSLLLLVIVRRQLFPVTIRWDLRRFGRMLARSRFFAAQQLLAAASSHAEALVLPRLIGIDQFGVFGAGAMPASRLTALPDGLCTAAYPTMVKACAKGNAHGASHVRNYLLVGLLGGAAAALVGMFAAEPLARVLFPQRWELMTLVMRLTVWSLPLVCVESVMGYALNAAGADSAQARVSVPAAIVSLACSVLLVFSLGLVGACWTMLLRPAIRIAFMTPLLWRTFGAAAPGSDFSLQDALGSPTPALRRAG